MKYNILFRYDPNQQATSKLEYAINVNPLKKMDSTSDYDIVGLEIIMERNINKYIIHYYIPSFLMLTLSWASFNYRSYIYSGIHSLQ